jgi:hypothetical protein
VQSPALALIAAALLAGSLALRIGTVDQAFSARQAQPHDEDFLRSPGPELLHVVTFEHPLGWADVVWLGIIQDLWVTLTERRSEASLDRMVRWAHLATDLDRAYFVVYQGVSCVLSAWAKRADQSDEIATSGMVALPERWELPWQIGYNAYFLRGDVKRASEMMFQAARLPNAPRYLYSLADRMRFQSGDEAGAIAILESMLQDPSTDENIRADIEERLKVFRSEPRLRKYDAACTKYLQDKGSAPKSAQALLDARYVDEPPVDLFDAPIVLTLTATLCHASTSAIKIREDDAKRERVRSQLYHP